MNVNMEINQKGLGGKYLQIGQACSFVVCFWNARGTEVQKNWRVAPRKRFDMWVRFAPRYDQGAKGKGVGTVCGELGSRTEKSYRDGIREATKKEKRKRLSR